LESTVSHHTIQSIKIWYWILPKLRWDCFMRPLICRSSQRLLLSETNRSKENSIWYQLNLPSEIIGGQIVNLKTIVNHWKLNQKGAYQLWVKHKIEYSNKDLSFHFSNCSQLIDPILWWERRALYKWLHKCSIELKNW